MIDTIIDPKLWERAKKEGIKEGIKEGELKRNQEVAKRLLRKGLKVYEVSEITDLSVVEIQKL